MSSVYTKTLEHIDHAHAQDPKKVTVQDQEIPHELHYANKMTKYLDLREPNASELLRLAVRAQHLRRWELPRSSYPEGRAGYFAWRTAQSKRQADCVREICLECGYPHADADRVARLVRKEDMKIDEECQVLEDVACLVFLDDSIDAFEKGQEEEKVVGILRKTWGKMSGRGREMVWEIPMSERAKGLITRALESG